MDESSFVQENHNAEIKYPDFLNPERIDDFHFDNESFITNIIGHLGRDFIESDPCKVIEKYKAFINHMETTTFKNKSSEAYQRVIMCTLGSFVYFYIHYVLNRIKIPLRSLYLFTDKDVEYLRKRRIDFLTLYSDAIIQISEFCGYNPDKISQEEYIYVITFIDSIHRCFVEKFIELNKEYEIVKKRQQGPPERAQEGGDFYARKARKYKMKYLQLKQSMK